LNVFNPVLKEYKDAESGRTHGIRMSERKSAKMMNLTKYVKKLTYCMWAFIFVSFIYCEVWVVGQFDRFIDAYYITKQNPNATFAQEFINVETDVNYHNWGPRWDDFDDVFGDDDSGINREQIEREMDEEMHELKEIAERTDREHEQEGRNRREHHHGGSRSRVHSFYPSEDEMEAEREYRHSSDQYENDMGPKKHYHRHSSNQY